MRSASGAGSQSWSQTVQAASRRDGHQRTGSRQTERGYLGTLDTCECPVETYGSEGARIPSGNDQPRAVTRSGRPRRSARVPELVRGATGRDQRVGGSIPSRPTNVMSRDTVSRCLGTSLHFGVAVASRRVMVAPSLPGSRPGPCGWPAASLDSGCGRHRSAGIGMPGGVWPPGRVGGWAGW